MLKSVNGNQIYLQKWEFYFALPGMSFPRLSRACKCTVHTSFSLSLFAESNMTASVWQSAWKLPTTQYIMFLHLLRLLTVQGTKQGGVLSPYLFTRYIRQLLYAIIILWCWLYDLWHECQYFGLCWWHCSCTFLEALQIMLDLLCKCCKLLDITCTPAKTVLC